MPSHVKSTPTTVTSTTTGASSVEPPDDTVHERDSETSDHAHVAKNPSILTAMAAAFINFLLMFGLCCAYGMIMFEDPWNQQHRGLAVKMNLGTALLVGVSLAGFSKVGVAIGGPDLNPVVFLGMFVQSIAAHLAEEKGLDQGLPGRRLISVGGLWRGLAAVTEEHEFCTGKDLHGMTALQYETACKEYHEELVATTIFATMASSAILGLLFFCLGRFELSCYVSYLPTNIMEAFLSCIGYKVFKYAIKFCNYEPRQFIPAACIGVPLYFVKAFHLGNPAIVMPLVLLAPLLIFYIIAFTTGGLESARKFGWMFDPPIETAEFWRVWSDGVVGAAFATKKVNFQAWFASLSNLPVMIVVCTLDCMLKLYSTESKMPVKVDQDYEMQLYGRTNLATTLFGCSVGYMQLKFNVINYGVMGNVSDRRAGLLYALLCGVFFFWTTELFNLLPQFFLSTLLFFAGSGFVAENLWGSRKYLSIWEWIQVLIILGVFIFSQSLLIAVIVGGLLAGLFFIECYSHVTYIAGRPMLGGEVKSVEVRPPGVQCAIQQVANSWSLVIRLKGFLFFASAHSVTAWLSKHLTEQRLLGLPEYTCVHWVILDCTLLDGMDSSASKAFSKLANALRVMGVRLIWSSMKKEVLSLLKNADTIINDHEWFHTQDAALHHIENVILHYITKQQRRWTQLHPAFEVASQVISEHLAFEPWQDVLPVDTARFGCPWRYCSRMTMKAGQGAGGTNSGTVLCKAGRVNGSVFLVHSGKVGLFSKPPAGDSSSQYRLEAVCGRGRFVNSEALLKVPPHFTAVALQDGEVLFWTSQQWAQMEQSHPSMATAVFRAILKQQDTDAANQRAEHAEEEGPNDAIEPTHSYQSLDFSAKFQSSRSTSQNSMNDFGKMKPARSRSHGNEWWSQGMAVALALDELGLFEPVQEPVAAGANPPDIICQDISIAFKTYTYGGSVESRLAPECVGEALQYAGIFGPMFMQPGAVPTALNEAEFLALGVEASMASFGEAQVEKILDIFKRHDPEGSGFLKRSDMLKLLCNEVHAGLTHEEVDGLVGLWREVDRIDKPTFIAMMQRFVKKHELFWCILVGLRGLGQRDTTSSAELCASTLIEATDMVDSEAEELLWCMKSFGREGGLNLSVEQLPLTLFAATTMVTELPPAPRYTESVTTSANDMLSGISLTEKTLADFRGLVVGLADVENTPPRVGCHCRQPVLDAVKGGKEKAKAAQEPAEVVVPDTLRAKLHMILDHPGSSNAASTWAVFIGIMILVSVLTLFLEPLVTPPNKDNPQSEKSVWLGFEAFFTIIFTVEFLARVSVADALGTQTVKEFCQKPLNICDLVAVLPFYLDRIIDVNREEFRLFRVMRLLKLSRVVRLGRLAYRSAAFAPIAVILVVIWGIYMMNSLKEK